MTRLPAWGSALVLMVIVAACIPAGPTPVPTMSSEDLAACEGIPAPRPTLPDFGPDDAYLDRIIEPLRAEVMARAPEFNSISTDGIEHIIVIGALHPTKEICDDLHARYGPWIRVRQQEPVQLLGSAITPTDGWAVSSEQRNIHDEQPGRD